MSDKHLTGSDDEKAHPFIELLRMLENSGLSYAFRMNGAQKNVSLNHEETGKRQQALFSIRRATKSRVPARTTDQPHILRLLRGEPLELTPVEIERFGNNYLLLPDGYKDPLLDEHRQLIAEAGEEAVRLSHFKQLAESYNEHLRNGKEEESVTKTRNGTKLKEPVAKHVPTLPDNRDNPLTAALVAILRNHGLTTKGQFHNLTPQSGEGWTKIESVFRGTCEVPSNLVSKTYQSLGWNVSILNPVPVEIRYFRRAIKALANLQYCAAHPNLAEQEPKTVEAIKAEADKVIALAETIGEWAPMAEQVVPAHAPALIKKIASARKAKQVTPAEYQTQLSVHLDCIAACADGVEHLGLSKSEQTIFRSLIDKSAWSARQAVPPAEQRLMEDGFYRVISKAVATIQEEEAKTMSSKYTRAHTHFDAGDDAESRSLIVAQETIDAQDRFKLISGEAERDVLEGAIDLCTRTQAIREINTGGGGGARSSFSKFR